jgi:hypothetical protein
VVEQEQVAAISEHTADPAFLSRTLEPALDFVIAGSRRVIRHGSHACQFTAPSPASRLESEHADRLSIEGRLSVVYRTERPNSSQGE